MTTTGRNGPLVPHMRPCALHRHNVWIGDTPPSKRMYFWGLLTVCMALKTLQCCGNSSSPEQGALWGLYTPSTPPKITSASLRGCKLFIQIVSMERKASRGALGGHFRRQRPWLWRLWCQLCFVIRLMKLSIKTLNLVVCNHFLYELLYIVKRVMIHALLIVVWTKP